MDLRVALEKGQSRANCNAIVAWIGSNQQRFDALTQLFFKGDPTMVQRAAWPLSVVVETYPHMVLKHLPGLLKYVQQPGHHEAVKRNTVRIFQFIDIPEEFHGELMNLCFDYVANPAEKPAVKAFSLTVLEHLSRHYPEILQELKTIIDDRWDTETAAFRSRSRKIFKQMTGK